MRFTVKDHLTEQEVSTGLKSVTKDGLTTQAMVTFTSGAFLVAFALKLGASNFVIGLLAAIPPLTQLLQIPSIYLVEKVRNRRAIVVYFSSASRIILLFIAFIPLLFSIEIGLIIFITALMFHTALAAPSSCSWNSWMRDLISQDKLGSFFSKRMGLAVALGIVLSLIAGIFVDYWKTRLPAYEIYSYSILFVGGFLAGMLGIYFLSNVPEPRMEVTDQKMNFFLLIRQPFRDTNFKNLIVFLATWNFAINLAAPFFTVYMLKRLSLSMSYVIGLTILSQIFNLAFLRIWGKFSDRFSNKSVISVSGPLFIICIICWTFTTLPEKYFLTAPLLIVLHIFMGISIAGVTLSAGNIGLKLAPKGMATAYLATIALMNSLAAGIAPVIGGLFADFFAGRGLTLTLNWISPEGGWTLQPIDIRQWDFFFLFAFLIGQYSLHRLALVKEVGDVEEDIVIRELFFEVSRKMRNLSSVSGIRQMVNFPFALLKNFLPVKYFVGKD